MPSYLSSAWNYVPQSMRPISAFSAGGSLPYGDLASATNQFMTGQAAAPYIANLPNYANLVGQASSVTGQQLQGQVPQDVKNLLATSAAEKGIATGLPGSPANNAALLRALGLTSMGVQKEGMANLHQMIADTPVPQLFNPASLFVPEHLANLELSAAHSGANRGGGSVGGSIYNPGGSLGASGNLGHTSYHSQPAQIGPVGRTGYFDDEGLFNSGSFSGGMWNYNAAPSSGDSWYHIGEPNYMQTAAEAPYSYLGGGWSDINPDYYANAGYDISDPGYYDYGSMFSDAGMPYTDWSNSGVDWSGLYE